MNSQSLNTSKGQTQNQDFSDNRPEWMKKIDEYYNGLEQYYLDQTSSFQKIYTTLYGIYTTLLVFFGFAGEGALHQYPSIIQFLFLIPIVFWCFGMFEFLMVQAPHLKKCRPGDYFCYREAMLESTSKKAEHYERGILISSFGLLIMLVPIVIGLFFVNFVTPFPQNSEIELVIDGNYQQFLKEAPIPFYNNSSRTQPVTLLEKTSAYYRIQNSDGDILNVPNEWVKIVIIKNPGKQRYY